ncbi:MAG: hypothetical protein SVS85_00825, partial [Candidatus Nanohaloarchaea archaeon]|nr:hypothetical protein [Candidatus Nanohaloarchaea archaeon]
GAYVSTRDWVPLNENDMQGVNRSTGLPSEGYGIRGVDSPALLIGKARQSSDRFVTFYRVVMRRMFDPDTGQTYRIDLVKNGNLEVSGGSHKVILRSGEDETETGSGIDGGTLHRQKVLVRVS